MGDAPSEDELFNGLAEILLRVPMLDRIVKDFRELTALVRDRRAPRIAVVGRRGSGKSSLANALLGAPVLATDAVDDTAASDAWLTLEHAGRTVSWLDTPGLRAGAVHARRDEVRRSLRTQPPDVLLATVRVTQVDTGIDDDAIDIAWLLARVKEASLVPPALVGVVTRCDEMAPLVPKAPPFTGEKRANIEHAVEVVRPAFVKVVPGVAAIVPVCTYQRFSSEGARLIDWRWNLDALVDAIFAALPPAAQVEGARAFGEHRALRHKVAMRIVTRTASVAFVVGIVPLPFADLAVLAPLQVAMVTAVMHVAGRKADSRAATEWLAGLGVNAGAGLALREAARGLVKLVPGFGATASGAVAASGTYALGVSAAKYFIEGASLDAARAAFETARNESPPADTGDDDGV